MIFRSRIRSLVNFMKFLYLDKKDRIIAWFTLRNALAVATVLAVLLALPLRNESVSGRFVLEPSDIVEIRARVAGTISQLDAEGVNKSSPAAF